MLQMETHFLQINQTTVKKRRTGISDSLTKCFYSWFFHKWHQLSAFCSWPLYMWRWWYIRNSRQAGWIIQWMNYPVIHYCCNQLPFKMLCWDSWSTCCRPGQSFQQPCSYCEWVTRWRACSHFGQTWDFANCPSWFLQPSLMQQEPNWVSWYQHCLFCICQSYNFVLLMLTFFCHLKFGGGDK